MDEIKSSANLNLECLICQQKFEKKSNLSRHLNTQKHKNRLNGFKCNCGKFYKHNSSYLRHLKSCNYFNDDSLTMKDVVLKMADNSEEIKNVVLEQQKLILEQQKEIKELKLNSSSTNIYNSKFNLNLFLNEECKDAMNLTEFIDQINICGKDLVYSGLNGTEQGLINIFTTNLNQLGKYKRPIHCSDQKRKTLYVQNNDSWEKDTEKDKFSKSLHDIYVKQIQQIQVWEHENPGWKDDEQKKDEYIRIVSSIMTDYDKSKVINEVTKQITINK